MSDYTFPVAASNREYTSPNEIPLKCKFQPRTGHDGPEGPLYYMGMGGQRQASAASPPGNRPDIIIQEDR